ncbi:MAG TPA: DUF4235 domain-containing protein [Trebonia sp.]|nr:DUF4235 domain-containing protein [Trebonia sp.]
MAKQGSKQNGDVSKKLVTTIATAAAVWAARKLLAMAWRGATGKTPPDPADPQVRIVEALGWAALVGVTVEATRLFTARATGRRTRRPGDGQADA